MVLERLLRERRPLVPDFAEAKRAADADGGLEPAFEGGRAGRVVAAEADAAGAHAVEVEIVSAREVVERSRNRDLVVRVNVRRVAGLALAGTIKRERRQAATEENVLPLEELLLRRVEPGEEEDERRTL